MTHTWTNDCQLNAANEFVFTICQLTRLVLVHCGNGCCCSCYFIWLLLFYHHHHHRSYYHLSMFLLLIKIESPITHSLSLSFSTCIVYSMYTIIIPAFQYLWWNSFALKTSYFYTFTNEMSLYLAFTLDVHLFELILTLFASSAMAMH